MLQVVSGRAALAQSGKRMPYTGETYYSDPVVLLVSDRADAFYDGQAVACPEGRAPVRTGTYRYKSKGGWRTVPVVRFDEGRTVK